jgi:virulence-associated protein VagC
MAAARIFKSRNSQTVQLPEEFRTKSAVLEIFHCGDDFIPR